VASLVAFKFIFALIYTLKWNCRRCRNSYYRNPKFNLNEEFKKKMRKDRSGAYSTDEDEDD